MASYRQIHTCIWKDAWFFDLSAEHKLLWIYLFSNERANLTGLYDIHKRIIAFETGLAMETIDAGFEAFAKAGKAFYEDGWVWVPNLIKYNAGSVNSSKIRTHIVGALAKIADTPLKARCIEHYNSIVDEEYRIDTLSIGYPTGYAEHEQEHEQEHEHKGADAPAPLPSSYNDWLVAIREPQRIGEKNGIAVLARMGQALYPNFPGDDGVYKTVGALAKKARTQSNLARIMWDNSTKPLADPIDYLFGVLRNHTEAPARKQQFDIVGDPA